MMAGMRAILAGICCATIAASCWLATMFVVLHRDGYPRGVAVATLFVVQSLLTLGVLSGKLASVWVRTLAMAGAAAIVLTGIAVVASKLSGPHFEGYALMIGLALAVQGVVTLVLFASGGFKPWTKVHQFGT